MQRGFSLVELSIVLVILGLLTGGILAGQSLIRAAEIRSISSDIGRFNAAINSFRDKYMALPGDFRDAVRFWTAADGDPATCRTTESTTMATCDGNGNGVIGTVDAGTTWSEYFRSWQHLANAGLIEGRYTGAAGGGGTAHHVFGSNSPRSKLSNTGYSLISLGARLAGDTSLYEGNYGNVIELGNQELTTIPYRNALAPEEAWNIDTKMDDGRAGYGKVRGREELTTCTSNTNPASAEYLVTTGTKTCGLIFITGF